MAGQNIHWIHREFPRNYLFRHPLPGAFLILVFSLVFVLLYKPLGSHPGRYLGYEATMLAYCLVSALSACGMMQLLRRTRFFADNQPWTLGKELLVVAITLAGIGVSIYLAGFILEEPTGRLNLPTLLDSLKNGFLAGLVPFGIFMLVNFRHILSENEIYAGTPGDNRTDPGERLIRINSRLKKEELDIYPSRLILIESEGNYVNFFLQQEGKVQKQIIRNSINDIETQLSEFPFLYRTHRAFIVNLRKVEHARGNSLGYRLKVTGIDGEIPVSRNKSKHFRQLLKDVR